MLRAGITTDNHIYLITDDLSIKSLLEFTHRETRFNPFVKQWRTENVTDKIYLSKKKQGNYYYFELGLGWAAYVINIFSNHLLIDDKKAIESRIYSDAYRTIPFPGLRDIQNQDILHILKYRVGLYSVYTGYGKTQVISTLADYAVSLGKKVLILAPSIKAMDELRKRIKTLFRYDIKKQRKLDKICTDDGMIRAVVTAGVMNSGKYKDPAKLAAEKIELGTYEWVLADEVEYVMSPGGKMILDMCTGATNLYGFSGTADKNSGEMISFAQGLNRSVIDNKDLVTYFGPSLVYRLPLHLNIDLITIKTAALDKIEFSKEDFKQDSNVYMNVMNRMWTDDEVCQVITKLAEHYPKLFIPINNLSEVISTWIDNYWLGKFRVLLVAGEGYIYYDLQGNRIKLTLQEACDKIGNNEVDIIPSTSSGYRALDFPGLENILLVQGNIAGVVLQCIGRIRGNHMNIISLDSLKGKKIPVHTKGLDQRRDMILEYYKYSKVNEITITENEIGKPLEINPGNPWFTL